MTRITIRDYKITFKRSDSNKRVTETISGAGNMKDIRTAAKKYNCEIISLTRI